MGLDGALRMTLLGEVYDAATALSLDLVTEIHDDPMARGLELATTTRPGHRWRRAPRFTGH
jgi:enoyl-CoA hydratase/carnithine racemase